MINNQEKSALIEMLHDLARSMGHLSVFMGTVADPNYKKHAQEVTSAAHQMLDWAEWIEREIQEEAVR